MKLNCYTRDSVIFTNKYCVNPQVCVVKERVQEVRDLPPRYVEIGKSVRIASLRSMELCCKQSENVVAVFK